MSGYQKPRGQDKHNNLRGSHKGVRNWMIGRILIKHDKMFYFRSSLCLAFGCWYMHRKREMILFFQVHQLNYGGRDAVEDVAYLLIFDLWFQCRRPSS